MAEHINVTTLTQDRLRARFEPIAASIASHQKLRTWRQFGSIQDYTSGFLALCEQVGYMHESERIDRYIGGLKHDIAQEIQLRGVTDFQEILAMAEKLDFFRRSRPGAGSLDPPPATLLPAPSPVSCPRPARTQLAPRPYLARARPHLLPAPGPYPARAQPIPSPHSAWFLASPGPVPSSAHGPDPRPRQARSLAPPGPVPSPAPGPDPSPQSPVPSPVPGPSLACTRPVPSPAPGPSLARARPSLRGVPPPPLPPPMPLLLLLQTSLFLRTSGLLLPVRSATAARARVAGVVVVAATVVEVAAGGVVGAAVEVVAAVGLLARVGALVAVVEATVGVAAVEAVGLVAVGVALVVLVLEVASVSSSSVGARLYFPSSFVSGFCVGRLGVVARMSFARVTVLVRLAGGSTLSTNASPASTTLGVVM
ncbi:unnamed protein product [Closterium sp. NIES-53]